MIHQHLTPRDTSLLRLLRRGAVAVMLLMPWQAFVSTWFGTMIGPLWLWKSLPDIVIACLALAACGWAMAHSHAVRPIVQQPIVLLMIAYASVALIVTAVASQPVPQLAAGLAFGLRYVLLFCVIFATTWLLGAPRNWREKSAQYVLWAGVIIGVLGIIQVTVLPADFLTRFGYGPDTIAPVSTIDNNPDARRAFATLRGPNDYGALLVFAAAVAATSLLAPRYRVLLLTAATLGVAISGSRSAMLGVAVVLIVAVWLRYGRRLLRNTRALGVAAALAVAGGLVLYAATTIPALRLAVFHSSPGDSHLTEGSTDKHWQQTAMGIERVVRNPFGCGLGCAGPASFYGDSPRISENYYVQIAEETGIVGIILWVAMLAAVMSQLWRYADRDMMARALFTSGVGIAVVGIWLHVWADPTLSLTWWGLAGATIAVHMAQSYKTRYDTTSL